LFPEEKAKNPNTSANELISLSLHYPDEVLSNPILPLIALENPALWSQIVDSAYQVKDTQKQQRKQLSNQSIERQKMTLRFLLEMLAWLVGILLLLFIFGSQGSSPPFRGTPRTAKY
jgi:hypothetical protein